MWEPKGKNKQINNTLIQTANSANQCIFDPKVFLTYAEKRFQDKLERSGNLCAQTNRYTSVFLASMEIRISIKKKPKKKKNMLGSVDLNIKNCISRTLQKR